MSKFLGDIPPRWSDNISMSEQYDFLQRQINRRHFLKGAVALGLAAQSTMLWTQSTPTSGAPNITRHIAFGNDPQTQGVVSFASAAPFRRAVVDYGIDRAFGSTQSVEVRSVAGVGTRYGHARLDYLQPDTRYRYRIRVDEHVSAAGILQTAPNVAQPFTFTAFGDQGVSVQAAAIVAQVVRTEPRFHLLAGDMCYANMTGGGQPSDVFRPTLWDAWLAQIEPVAANTAWMCATGNHEMEAGFGPLGYDGFFGRFLVPTTGASGCPSSYAFRYSNVGVVCLDSNEVSYEIPANLNYSDGRQTLWLDQQLALFRAAGSGVDFVVVFFHHCAFSTNSEHGSDGGIRKHWVPVFDRHEVDLVINGHAHVYERTSQIRNGQVTGRVEPGEVVDAAAGTTYITAGGGGFHSYGNFLQNYAFVVEKGVKKYKETAEWATKARTSEHCYLAVEVTPRVSATQPSTMSIKAIAADGRQLDAVTLRRGGNIASSTAFPP